MELDRTPRDRRPMPPSLFATLRSIAHRMLPQFLRRPLVRSYFRLEAVFRGHLEQQFERRPTSLQAFEPVFSPSEFTGGAIVLVNSGLAPGGVERQIVSTLLGLGGRIERKLGLLCLRLGEDSELDFFKPALANFSGFVRNAMRFADAKQLLETYMPRSETMRIRRQIAWMPWDTREEIFRLVAEFAYLKPSVVHGWQDGAAIPAAYAARLVGFRAS